MFQVFLQNCYQIDPNYNENDYKMAKITKNAFLEKIKQETYKNILISGIRSGKTRRFNSVIYGIDADKL